MQKAIEIDIEWQLRDGLYACGGALHGLELASGKAGFGLCLVDWQWRVWLQGV